jgi:hypothetical protein
MIRTSVFAALILAAGALTLAPQATFAQQKTPAVKAGKGEKVCRVTLKYTNEKKTWVCKSAEPCCVWHEINYVKCGSTITGCL